MILILTDIFSYSNIISNKDNNEGDNDNDDADDANKGI